jgi:hypothetical protein
MVRLVFTEPCFASSRQVAKEVFASNAETEKQRMLRLEGCWALFLYVREEEQCFDLIPG